MGYGDKGPHPHQKSPYQYPPQQYAPYQQGPYGRIPPPPSSNPLAILSFGLGLMSLTVGCCCWTYIPLGIAACITGFFGFEKANREGIEGRNLAITGIILGGIALVVYTGIAILGTVLQFMEAATR